MAISDELKEIYQSAPHDNTYIETLEFSHIYVPTQRICNWHEPITTPDGDFVPLAFKAVLPKRDASGRQDFGIAIDATDIGVLKHVNTAITAPNRLIKIIYRVYSQATYATTGMLDDPIELDVSDVSYAENQVVFTASAVELVNRTFPRKRYRSDRWPSLVR